MKLTTKGRYAVTAVLDLSFHQDNGPVSLAEISERQNISLSYLEQLFARLRRNNIVVSMMQPVAEVIRLRVVVQVCSNV